MNSVKAIGILIAFGVGIGLFIRQGKVETDLQSQIEQQREILKPSGSARRFRPQRVAGRSDTQASNRGSRSRSSEKSWNEVVEKFGFLDISKDFPPIGKDRTLVRKTLDNFTAEELWAKVDTPPELGSFLKGEIYLALASCDPEKFLDETLRNPQFIFEAFPSNRYRHAELELITPEFAIKVAFSNLIKKDPSLAKEILERSQDNDQIKEIVRKGYLLDKIISESFNHDLDDGITQAREYHTSMKHYQSWWSSPVEAGKLNHLVDAIERNENSEIAPSLLAKALVTAFDQKVDNPIESVFGRLGPNQALDSKFVSTLATRYPEQTVQLFAKDHLVNAGTHVPRIIASITEKEPKVAERLISEMPNGSVRDTSIAQFSDRLAMTNGQLAAEWSLKIEDPKKRAEVNNAVMLRWSSQDFESAQKWAAGH